MRIRKIKKSDVREVVKLIRETFGKFNSADATKEGVEYYLSHHSDKKLDDELWEKYGSEISLVAVDDGKVVGIVKGKRGHLGNLFVLGNYHRCGIGRMLVFEFEKRARGLGSDKIKIRSSIYAVPFYVSCGYKKTTGVRSSHGIKVQPMAKVLR